MKYVVALLFASVTHATPSLENVCAKLHPGQYVILNRGVWTVDKTDIRTAREANEVAMPILAVLEQVCEPLSVFKDNQFLVCLVRANEYGKACSIRQPTTSRAPDPHVLTY